MVTPGAERLYQFLVQNGGSAPRSSLTGKEWATPADPADSADPAECADSPIDEDIGTLVSLHLVRLDPETGVVSVLNPRLALAASLGRRALEISRLHSESEQIRAGVEGLQEAFDSLGGADSALREVERSTDLQLVRSLLSHAAQNCVSEVLTAQPEALQESTLADSRPRDLALLQRGVRMRTIYPHTVLSSPTVQRHFSIMQTAGSEIRTASGIIERVVIFDREVAFLADRRDGAGGAVIIREPSVVEYLYQSLEQTWRLATPFVYTGVGYGETIDDIKSAILRLMAAGVKDEVVAKRMNMSTRACRRHISEILTELGAHSRFQAGVLAAGRGWTDGGRQDAAV
ncbi:LuxR C-terminal-related transcriptional regulator [Streptomyces sp. NPDC050560]|uniref:LuxR C-terminal-related transcriptional regulator n=1 Tax=Streptomyces sp. NPDC050560 TaxID=3365630 RepID=UPI0037B51C56